MTIDSIITVYCMIVHSGDHSLLNNPSVITVHTTTEDNSICVTCVLDSNSNGTCLLVLHPKPSLLHPHRGLSNIDVVLLNRSGNNANGCINGINHTSYFIATFLYNETQPIRGPVFVVRPQSKSHVLKLILVDELTIT